MLVSKSTLTVFLLVCFLSCSVSEDPQIQLITAHPGGDVTLPCKAPTNVIITVVKWIRSDPEKRVYLKIDGNLDPADQDPSYVNRVQLKDDEMKNGDLSLILKNVKSKDGGTYECRYVGLIGRVRQGGVISIVALNVKDPQIHVITADPGDDVTLSCQAPNNANIALVKWVRSDLNRSDPDRHVYLKRDGRLKTDDQDASYENRVQLEDDEMKNGDLSLILKNVNNNDEGTYVCRYEELIGRVRQGGVISIVYLKVAVGAAVIFLSVTAAVAAAAAVVAGGFVIYKKLKGRSENNSDLPDDYPEDEKLQEDL